MPLSECLSPLHFLTFLLGPAPSPACKHGQRSELQAILLCLKGKETHLPHSKPRPGPRPVRASSWRPCNYFISLMPAGNKKMSMKLMFGKYWKARRVHLSNGGCGYPWITLVHQMYKAQCDAELWALLRSSLWCKQGWKDEVPQGNFWGEQERVKGGLCVAIYGLAGWIKLLIAYLGILS